MAGAWSILDSLALTSFLWIRSLLNFRQNSGIDVKAEPSPWISFRSMLRSWSMLWFFVSFFKSIRTFFFIFICDLFWLFLHYCLTFFVCFLALSVFFHLFDFSCICEIRSNRWWLLLGLFIGNCINKNSIAPYWSFN